MQRKRVLTVVSRDEAYCGVRVWWREGGVSDRADNDLLQRKFAVSAGDHGQSKLSLGFVDIFDPAIDRLSCTAVVYGLFA